MIHKKSMWQQWTYPRDLSYYCQERNFLPNFLPFSISKPCPTWSKEAGHESQVVLPPKEPLQQCYPQWDYIAQWHRPAAWIQILAPSFTVMWLLISYLTSQGRWYQIYLIMSMSAFREMLCITSFAEDKCSITLSRCYHMKPMLRWLRAMEGMTGPCSQKECSPRGCWINTPQNTTWELTMGRNPQVLCGSSYTAQGIKHRSYYIVSVTSLFSFLYH